MMNKIVKAINKFVDGDFTINMKRKKKPERIEATHHEKTIDERAKEWHFTPLPALRFVLL